MALDGAGCLTYCMTSAATAQHPSVCGVFFSVSSAYTWAGSALRASPSREGLAACPDLSHQLSSPFVCPDGTRGTRACGAQTVGKWFSGVVCHVGSSSPGIQDRPCLTLSKENQNIPAGPRSIPGQENSITLFWRLARVTGDGPGHSDRAPAWVGQSWVMASACLQGERHRISPAHLAIFLIPSPLFILVRPRRRSGGRGIDGQTQQEAGDPQAWREPGVPHSWHPWLSWPWCKTPWVSRLKNELLLSDLLHLDPGEGKTQREHKHLWLTSCWRTNNLLLVDYNNICEKISTFCGKKSKPILSLGLGENLQSFQEAGLIPLRWNLMQWQMIFSSKPVLLENKWWGKNE